MNKLGFSRKTNKPPIKFTTDILTFGQYKDQTVEYILDNDPSYIIWMSDEKICDVYYEIYDKAVDLIFQESVGREINDLGFSWDDIMGDD